MAEMVSRGRILPSMDTYLITATKLLSSANKPSDESSPFGVYVDNQRSFGTCGMNTSSAHCNSAEYSLVFEEQLCGANGAVEV